MNIRREYVDKNRERLMSDYFLKVKTILGVIIALVSVGFFVGAAIAHDVKVLHLCLASVGLILVLVSSLVFIGAFSRRLSDEDVIELVKEDDNLAFADAFRTLAIENNKNNYIAPSIKIASPAYGQGKKTILFRYAKKQDKLIYSSGWDITFLFGPKTLFIHSYFINHITGIRTNENAVEVDYKDIITITTDVTVKQSAIKHLEVVSLIFGLSNGQNISVDLRSVPMKGKQPEPLTDRENEIVSIIRTTIRNNK